MNVENKVILSFGNNLDDLLVNTLRFLDAGINYLRFKLIKFLIGNKTVAMNVEIIDGSFILTDGCYLDNVSVTNSKDAGFRYPRHGDYPVYEDFGYWSLF